jgi:glycosyltransferase involved in cell wall biosynthesis
VRRRDPAKPPRVLVIVQNLPLPGDRRVWLECQALTRAGYEVAAISPAGPGDPREMTLDGVRLYHYPPAPATGSVGSFVYEFAYSWLQTLRLALRDYRHNKFDVIQACNPPDTYFALALLFRPFGVRFVFDQHDLCPEVYESRFDRPRPALRRGLMLLEWATYRTAAHVISTNESYRANALGRGRRQPRQVTVVRTGPDEARMRRGPVRPELRNGRRHLVVYVGVMGPQDGVDVVVDAVDHIVNDLGRTDVQFAILGAGDCWSELRSRITCLRLDDVVTMPGRVSDQLLFDYLSSADVGLSPDRPSPLNDVSTMNKTMEYMAFELPVLAFDLKETRVSAGAAAEYVVGDSTEYAMALLKLLDDSDRRRHMGDLGRQRVEQVLAWRHQEEAYVGVFDGLMGAPARRVNHEAIMD